MYRSIKNNTNSTIYIIRELPSSGNCQKSLKGNLSCNDEFHIMDGREKQQVTEFHENEIWNMWDAR